MFNLETKYLWDTNPDVNWNHTVLWNWYESMSSPTPHSVGSLLLYLRFLQNLRGLCFCGYFWLQVLAFATHRNSLEAHLPFSLPIPNETTPHTLPHSEFLNKTTHVNNWVDGKHYWRFEDAENFTVTKATACTLQGILCWKASCPLPFSKGSSLLPTAQLPPPVHTLLHQESPHLVCREIYLSTPYLVLVLLWLIQRHPDVLC